MNITTIIGYLAAFWNHDFVFATGCQDYSNQKHFRYFITHVRPFTAGTLFWLIYGLSIGSYQVSIANIITFIFASIILVYKIRYK